MRHHRSWPSSARFVRATLTTAPLLLALWGCGDSTQSPSSNALNGVVALIGDASCDAVPIVEGDADRLIQTSLSSVGASTPAVLVVTSIRGASEATVLPAVVTLASGLKGAESKRRDIEAQMDQVSTATLRRALTVPPTDECGTDIFGAVSVVRDIAAGGTSGPVATRMTIVIHSNGFQVETVPIRPWLSSHPTESPYAYGESLSRGALKQDLKDVRVIFIGLGRYVEDGRRKATSATEYRRLEEFWTGWIKGCGGSFAFLPTIDTLADSVQGGQP